MTSPCLRVGAAGCASRRQDQKLECAGQCRICDFNPLISIQCCCNNFQFSNSFNFRWFFFNNFQLSKDTFPHGPVVDKVLGPSKASHPFDLFVLGISCGCRICGRRTKELEKALGLQGTQPGNKQIILDPWHDLVMKQKMQGFTTGKSWIHPRLCHEKIAIFVLNDFSTGRQSAKENYHGLARGEATLNAKKFRLGHSMLHLLLGAHLACRFNVFELLSQWPTGCVVASATQPHIFIDYLFALQEFAIICTYLPSSSGSLNQTQYSWAPDFATSPRKLEKPVAMTAMVMSLGAKGAPISFLPFGRCSVRGKLRSPTLILQVGNKVVAVVSSCPTPHAEVFRLILGLVWAQIEQGGHL